MSFLANCVGAVSGVAVRLSGPTSALVSLKLYEKRQVSKLVYVKQTHLAAFCAAFSPSLSSWLVMFVPVLWSFSLNFSSDNSLSKCFKTPFIFWFLSDENSVRDNSHWYFRNVGTVPLVTISKRRSLIFAVVFLVACLLTASASSVTSSSRCLNPS